MLLACIIVITGCRSTSARERDRVALPGELIVAVDAEPKDGFDPLVGWGRYGGALFQSTLLHRNSDQKLVGDLAEHAELSDDRMTWRIRIRRDAFFHDGHPLTAQDVAFTFNQAARSSGKTDVTVLREAAVTGSHELELRLREPRITFVNRLATLGIVPAHAYGPDYGRHPIGSGPYRFVRWDEGRQLVMQVNERYYGDRPQIQRVVVLYLDEDAAFASARAHAVHVVRIAASLAKRRVERMRVVNVPSVDNRGISFPCVQRQPNRAPGDLETGNDVTSDVAIRRAINIAIDRAALVRGVLDGFGSAAYGPVSHLPWDQATNVVRDGQVEAARELLAQAGWHDTDGDGIIDKQGTRAEFVLLYPADDLIRQGLAMAVSDMLRPIGVSAIVTARSWEQIYKLMHANAVLFGFGSFDQTELHNLFYSGHEGQHMYNAGLYQNAQVDSYLSRAMSARSEDEAIEFWKLAQWDGQTGIAPQGDAPWAWLVNLDHVYLVDERLDTGVTVMEQHGTNILATLPQWRWKGAH